VTTTPLQRGTATSGSADSGTTYTVPGVTGVVSGDLLLAWVVNAGSSAATAAGLSVAGGGTWTKVGSGITNSPYGAGAWFWRIAGGSEPANYTVTFNGPSSAAIVVAYQAGTFDASNPVPSAGTGYGSNSAQSGTLTAPSVTGINTGRLVCGFAHVGTNVATNDITPGGSLVELADVDAGALGFTDSAVCHVALAANGATAAQTATTGANRRAVTGTVALTPFPDPIAYTASPADTAAGTDAGTGALGYARTAADTAAGADARTAVLTKGVGPDLAAVADSGRTLLQTLDRQLSDRASTVEQVTVELQRPDIVDYQFVIPIDPWMPFGYGQTVVVSAFDPGSAESRNQDIVSPVADVRHFGTDLKTPPTWSFELYTDVSDPTQALTWAANFEAVWDQEATRTIPGMVLPLRYALAGRLRRVYGRPRNFALIPSHLRTGRVDMLGDFVLAENTYYDDAQQSIRVGLRPSTVQRSGFTFPITFPMSTTPASIPRQETMTIGGTRPTWVDVTFYGPAVDPYVLIGDKRWGLSGSLAGGRSVRMSGIPWQQGLLRDDGAWVPGMLDPRARLSQLRFKPGSYTVTFGANAVSSDAHADVAWRNAYGTM
jgi:hypothetical protein